MIQNGSSSITDTYNLLVLNNSEPLARINTERINLMNVFKGIKHVGPLCLT
ncbi:hypothetical protein NARC_220019 [Candidatus Nitrosocosmicus arcticus]|uniref:Uncharacterized protein n=1 Tax=Candidatus Nitrosocosmicus arcticus TaxID=2035267 RepID=A0A557SR21_9ARCH|nr:hypothetical protein NARC_220019 [Candidatus Nitrosocosmicus arcticus]